MKYLTKTTYFGLVALLLAPAWRLLSPGKRATSKNRQPELPPRSVAPLY